MQMWLIGFYTLTVQETPFLFLTTVDKNDFVKSILNFNEAWHERCINAQAFSCQYMMCLCHACACYFAYALYMYSLTVQKFILH